MNQRHLDLIRASENSALAIVVSTWGSAPRPMGSCMVVNENMDHVGSVSGGCVEADVITNSVQVMLSGTPTLVKYSVADDLAFDLGLACGGDIEIFIKKVDAEIIEYLSNFIKLNSPIYYCIDLDKKIINWDLSEHNESKPVRKILNGKDLVFGVFSPTPNVILIGGGEISVEFVRLASAMGYRTTIIEPRKAYVSSTRFQDTTTIINKWPDEALHEIVIDKNSALVTLSHDPKIDDPALAYAMSTDMFYVGALGSKRTHKKRLERLKTQVSNPEALERIKSPVGVEIYAKTAQEIAISILAEIIQTKNK